MTLHLIYRLILILLSIALMGCSTIGIKEKHTIVYVTYGQHEDAFDNLIRVATNKKIPVTVGDMNTQIDVGGYYVIAEQDLKKFKKRIAELIEIINKQ